MMKKNNLILVVDDEECIVEIISGILSQHEQLEVVTALCVKEGLYKFKEMEIDCIISDVNMPGDDGIEFLKQVRSVDQSIPFVLYTGYGTNDLRIEALKYNVSDFLDKPELEGLEDTILRLLAVSQDKNKEKEDMFDECDKLLRDKK